MKMNGVTLLEPFETQYQNWIKALIGGGYKKGESCLRTKDKYCCLGVLCDLYDPSRWLNLNASDPDDTDTQFSYQEDGENYESEILPEIVESSLRTMNGAFNANNLSTTLQKEVVDLATIHRFSQEMNLTNLNDNTNSFDLIVRVLQERPRSLFRSECIDEEKST